MQICRIKGYAEDICRNESKLAGLIGGAKPQVRAHGRTGAAERNAVDDNEWLRSVAGKQPSGLKPDCTKDRRVPDAVGVSVNVTTVSKAMSPTTHA